LKNLFSFNITTLSLRDPSAFSVPIIFFMGTILSGLTRRTFPLFFFPPYYPGPADTFSFFASVLNFPILPVLRLFFSPFSLSPFSFARSLEEEPLRDFQLHSYPVRLKNYTSGRFFPRSF